MLHPENGWLVGWQKIAAYIGKTVKTAKRYHKLYGMPVRRDPGSTAVALEYELDRWLIEFDDLVKRYDKGLAFKALAKRFKKIEKSMVDPSETSHNDT